MNVNKMTKPELESEILTLNRALDQGRVPPGKVALVSQRIRDLEDTVKRLNYRYNS